MKEIVGYVAGFVGAGMMFPQVYQVVKTNSTKDISIGSIFLIIICSFLWIWYGILIKDLPLIITDVVIIMEEIIILIYKIKNDIIHKNSNEQAEL
tara:strand:- start:1210 stop:1494 length:285 start_codon:yes stop_codon:yes gene_type:complete